MRDVPASVNVLFSNPNAVLEPVVVVDIFWPNGKISYAQKDLSYAKGKILDISEIEDVVVVSNGASDGSVTILLDDSDLEIQSILGKQDIINVKVVVYQWFIGVPENDRIHLFTGTIQSPIEYNRQGRTISLTILSRYQGQEFGFSPEEGEFAYLPAQAVGVPWPTIYGTVYSLPLLQIQEAPSAVLKAGFGIVNDPAWERELSRLSVLMQEALTQQLAAFSEGVRQAYLSTRYDDPFNFGSFGTSNDPEQARTHRQASQEAFARAEEYAIDRINLSLQRKALVDERDEQRKASRGGLASAQFVGVTFPVGPRSARLSNLRFKVSSSSTTIKVIDPNVNQPWKLILKEINQQPLYRKRVDTRTLYQEVSDNEIDQQKFYWFQGGTKLYCDEDYSLSYVVSLGHVNVRRLKGKYNGSYVTVPSGLYNVQLRTHTRNGRTLQYTVVVLKRALTDLRDKESDVKWDSDEIWADVSGFQDSNAGANVTYVLTDIIQKYTNYQINSASFTKVAGFTSKYPLNFAITERGNVLDVLKSIAYQARCLLWLNNDTFYLRYLPEPMTALYTLFTTDIAENSLNLELPGTDDLTTKYVATFKPTLDYDGPIKVIYRYNIARYGVSEQEYQYTIYNNIEAVKKSAEFWSIRQSNGWKKISFTTSIQNIRIETMDMVFLNINAPWITRDNVTGLVESAVYDPSTWTIKVTVWLPIRSGEVDPYIFATPQNVQIVYPRLGDTQIETGNPSLSAGRGVELIPRRDINNNRPRGLDGAGSDFFSSGRGQIIADDADPLISGADATTSLAPWEVNAADVFQVPPQYRNFNSTLFTEVKPYQREEIGTRSASGIPGTIKNYLPEVKKYQVEAYLSNTNTPELLLVTQYPHNPDDIAGNGTKVRIERQSGGGYIMFMPTWVNEVDG